MREQVRGRGAPEVSFHGHGGFWGREERLGGGDVVFEVFEEVLVWVVGYDNSFGA